MEPSTSHGRGSLSAAVDAPSFLLVELPRFDDRDTSTCLDLLTATEAADEKLLIVSVTETIGKTHRRWDDHVGDHPDEFAVVSASFADPGAGEDQLEDPAGSTPAAADGPEPAASSWLTTHQVDDPGDLTGLGVTISSQLADWADADEQVVVCFRSLTTTLQYVGVKELVRFLSELRGHVEASGAIAHFHLDPDAIDRQTRAAIRSVVDGVVVPTADEPGVELLE